MCFNFVKKIVTLQTKIRINNEKQKYFKTKDMRL